MEAPNILLENRDSVLLENGDALQAEGELVISGQSQLNLFSMKDVFEKRVVNRTASMGRSSVSRGKR